MKKYFALFLSVLLICMIYINISISHIKPVKGTYMKTVEYTEYLNVSGEFESRNKTAVQLSYPVVIKEIFIKENSYVNKGQVLFSIDKEKMTKLLKGNIDTDELFLADYSNIEQLASLGNSDYSQLYNIPDVIYASSDGIISRLNIYPGAIVMSNRRLAVIRHTDDIVAKFTVSQVDYGKINIGDSVEIKPVAFENTSYNGVISSDNAVVKKQNTTVGSKVVVDVYATISAPDKKVADGLQINGIIQRGEVETISILDYGFINQDSNGQYVYIYFDGKAHKHYIETGVETENYTEIKTEFPPDTIFISGENLNEEDRIVLYS